jgi:hypothetical protein
MMLPSIHFTIHGTPIILNARSSRLISLFADYFQYYDPEVFTSASRPESPDPITHRKPLVIDLKLRRELPPREKLIPSSAELVSQTGVVGLWREQAPDQDLGHEEKFYIDLRVAAFRVEPRPGRAIGLISPQALEQPHILANTYTLFALLLLLRWRGVYHLHAAALVSPDHRLWLVCGGQRSGKTTLATALGIAGWRPICDDSLLISAEGGSPQIAAFKKHFHIADELIECWDELKEINRNHQYLDRTVAEGLEFFGTRSLAGERFGKIDFIVLPEIVKEAESRVEPLSRSAALLKLAEQSMYFQIWREHTERQWSFLASLAGRSDCFRLLAGSDILDTTRKSADLLFAEISNLVKTRNYE